MARVNLALVPAIIERRGELAFLLAVLLDEEVDLLIDLLANVRLQSRADLVAQFLRLLRLEALCQ